MTLVELLVAMAIGVGLTLAVSSMVVVGENHKRNTTSTNDAEQTGAYAFYLLDRALRSAGSGFAESAYGFDRGVLGCKLYADGNGAAVLPRTTAFPPPFATNFLSGPAPGIMSNLRVAPLLIAKNGSDSGGSDVLVVMGGSGAAGGVSRQVTGTGSATTLVLDNSWGFADKDLALVSQAGTGVTDCLLEEVSPAPTTPTLTLAGTYYTAGSATTLVSLSAGATSTSTYVTPLGNAAINNLQFTLFGVGAGRTLYAYDLLQNLKLQVGSGATDAVQAIADGVDSIHALYGIDTDADGKQNTWVDPGAAGYDIGTVMTTPATMQKIISVRVALVMRGEHFDKKPVSPSTITIFGGLTDSSGTALPGLAQTINLQPDDQYYRYRVFEFTVPLRNMLLLAGGP
jgi:type IV pilus assembly protein PilW